MTAESDKELYLPSGRTRLLGLVGHPIAHSPSPALHTWHMRQLGWDGVYVPFEVSSDEACLALLTGLMNVEGFCGANITIPFKGVCTQLPNVHIHNRVKKLGAGNTLWFHQEFNRWELANTDVDGVRASLHMAGQWYTIASTVVILGAGGAAAAVLGALAEEGHVGPIWVVARDPVKAREDRSRASQGLGAVGFTAPEGLNLDAARGPVFVINTLPFGHRGEANPVWDAIAPRLPAQGFFFDTLYSETPALQAAKRMGWEGCHGKKMFETQASEAFRLWAPCLREGRHPPAPPLEGDGASGVSFLRR